MISLFLTFLLGLFCCSSINNNAVDHTKEIEYKENQIKQAVPSVNSDGSIAYAYYFSSDLLSYEFAINFITYMSQNISTNWSSNNNIEPSYYFNNITAHVDLVSPNNFFEPRFNVNRLYAKKLFDRSYTIDNTEIFETSYNLVFMENDFQHEVFRVVYNVIAPIGFSAAIYSSLTVNQSILETSNWSYYENNNQGFAPITKCCYEHLYEGILFEPETYQSMGYNDGYNKGYNDGKTSGYQSGYSAGVTYAQQQNQTALTIFQGFIEVGLLPVNVFLQILNFEVFGINIAGLVSSLLTISLVIIIIRIITGKKDD